MFLNISNLPNRDLATGCNLSPNPGLPLFLKHAYFNKNTEMTAFQNNKND